MSNLTRRKFLQNLSLFSIGPSLLYGSGFSKKKPIPRIGYLGSVGVLQLENVFIEELKKIGFKNGVNIFIEVRLARPNTTETKIMAEELVKMDLLFVVAASLPQALEIRKANPNMAMIIATCPGMVSNGFAKNLEHPGGIYTGMDELPEGVTAKRLQLLKAAAPKATRIALLSTTPGTGGHETQLAEAKKAAIALGLEVVVYRAASLQELEKALNNLVQDGMDAILNFQGGLSVVNRQFIVDFIAKKHLPAIYQATAFADAGGLMTWAPDLPKQFQEAAHFAEKILNGSKPGDLSVKYPEKYYLTLNAATANKIGVIFSKKLLVEATRIIN
jgi:putative tryptophan/tyrosine transport system substrate-binding protein